jgi:hypothetical protein
MESPLKWLKRPPFYSTSKQPILLYGILLIVLFVISQLVVVQFFDKNTATRQAQKQAEQVISDVAEIYDVPTDEVPTLATVSDPSKLSDQAFFAKAQSGDRVLFYSKSRKAILYRPSAHKVIEVSSLTQSETSLP